MKNLLVFIFLIILTTKVLHSQTNDETFTPDGKPLALIFSNFNTQFSDGNVMPAFDITRAYLGYEYNFTPEWYARVVLDFGDPRAGRNQFSAFLKNAYLQYSKERLAVYFGMIATTQFKVSENIWGYRYIEESYQDLYNFNSSADLGITVEYSFSDMISADISVMNGEGYRRMQSDEFLRPGAGITLKPANYLTARVYADYMGKEVKQQSLATFLAYTGTQFTAGAEYNYQHNVNMAEGQHMYGPSFFTTYRPTESLKIFGRFDKLNSSTLAGETEPWQISDDGNLLMAGFEISPAKGVKFAPNFRWWDAADESAASVYSIFLNVELKF